MKPNTPNFSLFHTFPSFWHGFHAILLAPGLPTPLCVTGRAAGKQPALTPRGHRPLGARHSIPLGLCSPSPTSDSVLAGGRSATKTSALIFCTPKRLGCVRTWGNGAGPVPISPKHCANPNAPPLKASHATGGFGASSTVLFGWSQWSQSLVFLVR